MQHYLDWSTFIKLDNAATLDLVTSLTSALHDEGQLVERDVEALRQLLNTMPTQWSQEGRSILSGLMDEHASILPILTNRYGENGFSLNHIRFSMRPLVSDLLNKLAIWADLCLKKSELVFNRPFFVKRDSRTERRELFSDVLVGMAKLLYDTVGDLRHILNDVSTMRPSEVLDVTGVAEQMDGRIAITLGFAGIDSMGAFSLSERYAIQKLALSLSHLSEGIVLVLNDLNTNCQPSDLIAATNGQCELLSAEAQKFAGLSLPETNSLTVWETRRLAINFGIFTISQLIGDITHSTVNSLTPKDSKDLTSYLSRDVERALTAQLSSTGIDITTAIDASSALVKYCLHHKIQPSELIEPELKKIHAALTPATLHQFIKITSTDVTSTPGGAVSKERLVETSKTIRKGLASLSPFSVTFSLLLSLLICACGLKTPVKSDEKDIRPEVPFRGTAAVVKPLKQKPKAPLTKPKGPTYE